MKSEESMSNVSWPLPSSQSGASEELSVVVVCILVAENVSAL